MKHAPAKKKTAVAVATKTSKPQPKNSAKPIKVAVKRAVSATVPSKTKKPAVSSAPPKRVKAASNISVKKDKAAPKKARAILNSSAATAKAGLVKKVSAKKTTPAIPVKKTRAAAESQTINAAKKAKASAPKTSVSIKKGARAKTPVDIVKKSKAVKIKPIISTAKKLKTVKAPVKQAVPVRGKIKTATVKSSAANSPKKNNSVKLPEIVAAKKVKTIKTQTLAAPKNLRMPTPAPVAVKKKPTKVKQISAPVKQIKSPIVAKKTERLVNTKTVKVETPKPKSIAGSDGEFQMQRIFAAVKIRRQKIDFSPKSLRAGAGKNQSSDNGKNVTNRKKSVAVTLENKIEAVAAATAPKRKKQRAKAIGAAVFRGKKQRYDFQVFPLDSEFDAMASVSGIYVISKRKTDRNKRAHHALVCIGQTDSIAGEIKRHAKKCIKTHQANVISILPEANEKRRLKIEEDLKASHSIACGVE